MTGVVRTVARAGVAPATAVVYAEPIDAAATRAPRRFTLAQKNKTFQPRVLAVPVGSTVDFPNNDGIFHNVFSLSGPQPFDLGLYRAGETRVRTFTAAGTYRVFCNIHPQMTAIIVVAPERVHRAGRAGRTVHARLAAGPLSDDRAVRAVIAGVGGDHEHAGRVDRAGTDPGRVGLGLRAAQEQVREGLPGGRVSAVTAWGKITTFERRARRDGILLT